MLKVKLPLEILLSGFLPVLAQAASFDCAKASSPVENLICSDQELSALDTKLGVLYRDLTRSKAYLDLKETQRAWLKERNKCDDLICMKERYRERIAALTPSLDLPHYKLPPLDGVKHGAIKEVFDKLVKDYQSRPYQVAQPNGEKADNMGGHCMDLLNALRNGSAKYVSPTVITDDYNDARLDPYKREYRKYINSLGVEWATLPGADWFGGFIEERSESLYRPTRNFALYEMDLDGDSKKEIIFYGEFGVKDEWGSPGKDDTATPSNGNGYSIYKYTSQGLKGDIDRISVPEEFDYKLNRHLNHYSSLFSFNNLYYVTISYLGEVDDTFIDTTVYKLGKAMGSQGKYIYANTVCKFNLGS